MTKTWVYLKPNAFNWADYYLFDLQSEETGALKTTEILDNEPGSDSSCENDGMQTQSVVSESSETGGPDSSDSEASSDSDSRWEARF